MQYKAAYTTKPSLPETLPSRHRHPMRFLLPNQRIHPQRKRLFFGLLLLLILGTDQLEANDRVAASTLVDRAGVTLRNFIRDPEMAWFRGHIKESSGLLIVPRLRQAGFIIGGAGGNGVLLWRGESAAAWTGPAFYTLHLTPTEAQSDTEATELVLLVRSDTSREALLKDKLQLGRDLSLALGPVGDETSPATADLLQFARRDGRLSSAALNGSLLAAHDAFNAGYYGTTLSLADILVKHPPINRQHASLRKILTGIR